MSTTARCCATAPRAAGATTDSGSSATARPRPRRRRWRSAASPPRRTGVSAGDDTSCAARANGTLSCWGSNLSGGVGGARKVDLTNLDLTEPVDVLNITGATQVDASAAESCARLANGGVSCWGNAAPGDGVTAFAETPVPVFAVPRS